MVDAHILRAQQRMRQQAVQPAPTLQKKPVEAEKSASTQVPERSVQQAQQPVQPPVTSQVQTSQVTTPPVQRPVAAPAPQQAPAHPQPSTDTPAPEKKTASPVSKTVVTSSVRATYLEAGVSEESLHQSKGVRIDKALSDYAFLVLDKELDWIAQSGHSLEYAPARAKSTVSRARLYELGLMALFNIPLEGSTNAAERAVYGAFLRRVGSSEETQQTERAVEMVREDLAGVEGRIKSVEGMLRFFRKELAEMRVMEEYMVHSTLTSADVVRAASDLTLDTGASFRKSQQVLREQTKVNAHEMAAHPVNAQTALYKSAKRGQ